MKKNLIFLDLGGVVFQSTGRSNDQINWTIIKELNNIYGYDLNIGLDKFPDFMLEYNRLTGQYLSGIEFLGKLFDTLEMNTELVDMVKGYGEIIIVSDNYRENIQYISKRFDFESWAIDQVYSFDYQMVKSNQKFFHKLLQVYNSKDFNDLLLIDDSLSKLKSAALHGISTIHYKSNEQTKEELIKHFHA